MSKSDIINELLSIRATAELLVNRATQLENVLRKEEVSTSSTQSSHFEKRMAIALAKRGKKYLKK